MTMVQQEFVICLVIIVIGAILTFLIFLGMYKLRKLKKVNELEKRREELMELYFTNRSDYFDEVIEFNSQVRFLKKTNPKDGRILALKEIDIDLD